MPPGSPRRKACSECALCTVYTPQVPWTESQVCLINIFLLPPALHVQRYLLAAVFGAMLIVHTNMTMIIL